MPILLAVLLGSLAAASQASALIISEFRVRGPNGANDEFVELYNERGNPVTVSTSDGSSGWAVAASDGVPRFVVPNGTVIPPGGHYLGVNSVGYSLASYPAGNATTATGNATFTTDIPDNAGIALFNTSNSANFSSGTRLDAVGSTSEANARYKEGIGYPTLTPFSINYSFYRDLQGLTPRDTDDNSADFTFVDTNGTSAGAGQRLGAPGPENLSSPILGRTSGVRISLLDPSAGAGAPPNRVRDFSSDPPNNSTFGTLSLRRVLTNNTGAPITRLRLRIADQTTFPAPGGQSDLRARTAGAIAAGSTTVRGTTLEQPPSQPNGGAFNSTLGVGAITPADPLQPGESIPVRLLFGIQQTGTFRVCAYVEARPAAGGLIADAGGTDNQNTTTPNCAVPPPPASPPTPPGGTPPSNEFSFGKVKKNKKRGTAKLTVRIEEGPGELELAKTKKVKSDDEAVEAEGATKEKLAIKPKRKSKRKLRRMGRAKVKAEVTYAPTGGTANTQGKKVKLVKK